MPRLVSAISVFRITESGLHHSTWVRLQRKRRFNRLYSGAEVGLCCILLNFGHVFSTANAYNSQVAVFGPIATIMNPDAAQAGRFKFTYDVVTGA